MECHLGHLWRNAVRHRHSVDRSVTVAGRIDEAKPSVQLVLRQAVRPVVALEQFRRKTARVDGAPPAWNVSPSSRSASPRLALARGERRAASSCRWSPHAMPTLTRRRPKPEAMASARSRSPSRSVRQLRWYSAIQRRHGPSRWASDSCLERAVRMTGSRCWSCTEAALSRYVGPASVRIDVARTGVGARRCWSAPLAGRCPSCGAVSPALLQVAQLSGHRHRLG